VLQVGRRTPGNQAGPFTFVTGTEDVVQPVCLDDARVVYRGDIAAQAVVQGSRGGGPSGQGAGQDAGAGQKLERFSPVNQKLTDDSSPQER
jgi:hypothetical protein